MSFVGDHLEIFGAAVKKTGRERRQTIEASLGVSVLDRNIPADDEAPLLQSLQEGAMPSQPTSSFGFCWASGELHHPPDQACEQGRKSRRLIVRPRYGVDRELWLSRRFR
jgi:hypothetical protein